MSTRYRVVALIVVVSLPWSLAAQERSRTLTQMILGAGPIASHGNHAVPVYLLGVEVKPASSSVTWRLASEYWFNQYGFDDALNCNGYCGEERVFGLQALGIRTFARTRRLQPYVFGGAALYSTRTLGFGRLQLTDSGYAVDRVPFRSHDVDPALIWGAGFNVRVFGVPAFGELRMPLPSRGGASPSKAPPIMFGFRF